MKTRAFRKFNNCSQIRSLGHPPNVARGCTVRGGTIVTVYGAGFEGFDGTASTAVCRFEAHGEVSLTAVTVLTDEALECVAPQSAAPLHALVSVALNGEHFVGMPSGDDSGRARARRTRRAPSPIFPHPPHLEPSPRVPVPPAPAIRRRVVPRRSPALAFSPHNHSSSRCPNVHQCRGRTRGTRGRCS